MSSRFISWLGNVYYLDSSFVLWPLFLPIAWQQVLTQEGPRHALESLTSYIQDQMSLTKIKHNCSKLRHTRAILYFTHVSVLFSYFILQLQLTRTKLVYLLKLKKGLCLSTTQNHYLLSLFSFPPIRAKSFRLRKPFINFTLH